MTKAATLPLALIVLLAAAPAFCAQTQPQDAAINEAVYRQANTITLRQKLADARAAQERRALPTAAKLYDDAWDLVQKIGSGVDAERAQTIAGLSVVRLELARTAQGHRDYKEARTQVDDVLRVDPANAEAIAFKSGNEKLLAEQRGTIPSEDVQNQVPAILEEKVNASTLVHDAKLLYEMKKLDEAEAKLKQALKADPHNEAGLYYYNLVSEAKFSIAAKIHEVTMRQDIRAVEQAWANPNQGQLLPVPNPYATTNLVHTGQGRQSIITKLDRIRLDSVKYDGLPLGEVIVNLSDECKKRDPEKRGINFILNQQAGSASSAAPPQPLLGPDGNQLLAPPPEQVDMAAISIKINPALTDIRLADVLDAVTKVAERPIKYSIEDYAIVFSAKAAEAEPLYIRTFKVDPNTFYQGLQGVGAFVFGESMNVGQNTGGGSFGGSSGGGGGGGQGQNQNTISGSVISRVSIAPGGITGGRSGGGGQQQGGTGGGLNYITKTNDMQDVSRAAMNYFSSLGVDLDPSRYPGKSLFFNDRQGMLIVRATSQDLDMIEAAIQVLNIVPPQINIRSKIIEISQDDTKSLGFDWYLGNTLMRDGTIGMQGGTAPSFAGEPTSANPLGVFPGNPFAGTTIAPNTTDQLVTGGLRNPASALFTVTGILTDPQFRLVIHALQRRTGAEVLAQPEVTTTSGRQAQMKAVEVKTIITGYGFSQGTAQPTTGGIGGTTVNQAQPTVVYPFPEQMELGPVLDVIPCLLSDGFTINLTLIPTVTAFAGYDDPNSVESSGAINQSIAGGFIQVPTVLPRFVVRQVVSTVNVWDGQTVVLGGLLSETVLTIKDQIPMLGDLPLVGRFFRSESKNTQKRNLLIFVTPTLIDPAGNRLHTDDEMPFAQSAIPMQPPGVTPLRQN